jgi:hypothetical protein
MKPLINVNFEQLAKELIDDHGVKVEKLAYECGVSVNIIKAIHSGKTGKVEHSCGNRMLWEFEQVTGQEYS